MMIFACTGEPTILAIAGQLFILPDTADVAALEKAGTPVVQVDAAFMDNIKQHAS